MKISSLLQPIQKIIVKKVNFQDPRNSRVSFGLKIYFHKIVISSLNAHLLLESKQYF